jgi:ABC-2 type transport system permease protein
MSAIIKRELSSYFNSAIGYIVLAVFTFFSGLFFYMYCLLSNTTSMSYVFLSMLMIVMLVRMSVEDVKSMVFILILK